MENPQQNIARLLTALETLTREEEHLFNRGLHAESVALQERAMPLAAQIVALLTQTSAPPPLEPAVQKRLQALLQAREIHCDRLTAKLEETKTELQKLSHAAARLRSLRPIYHSSPAAPTFAHEA